MAVTSGDVLADLRGMADEKYRMFNAKLIPNIDLSTMLGVRIPQLRAYAKELLAADKANGLSVVAEFMDDLPHTVFEENMLHALLIGMTARTTDEAFDMLDGFLPFVDNWAVCDAISVKAFRSAKADADVIETKLREWAADERTYVVRYAVDTLMTDFLDDPRFRPDQLAVVAGIRSTEYYVNMARAWYCATALAKQWDAAITVFQPDAPPELRLDDWTHNKSIQKARESRRIPSDRKEYLAALKR
ncbi:DNA alkylation repair protein [Bifidobacterium eulemuris]|uniref:DNA alkylation repair protein n=1 Tax=Bifidobacterium eulemuris TaxID=1765219 RepID=A0A261GC06_9BIFI|nr:DNA alkylation repair protein [Bifidobacterium eulemuris]OZG68952.1 DNA alkylation repair protein [Bifidobacterium eulemuris]QOL31512.1 DNA alkylation repair protein [Bifidobacterium eulemuris]